MVFDSNTTDFDKFNFLFSDKIQFKTLFKNVEMGCIQFNKIFIQLQKLEYRTGLPPPPPPTKKKVQGCMKNHVCDRIIPGKISNNKLDGPG